MAKGLMRLSVVIKRSYVRVSGGFVLESYKVTKRGNGGFCFDMLVVGVL